VKTNEYYQPILSAAENIGQKLQFLAI